jgi:hypothetical protein
MKIKRNMCMRRMESPQTSRSENDRHVFIIGTEASVLCISKLPIRSMAVIVVRRGEVKVLLEPLRRKVASLYQAASRFASRIYRPLNFADCSEGCHVLHESLSWRMSQALKGVRC